MILSESWRIQYGSRVHNFFGGTLAILFKFVCKTVNRECLRSLNTNMKSEPQNLKCRIQYGGQEHDFLVKHGQFCSNLLRNGYSEVFEVADYESEVKILKFKMADLIWHPNT